VGEQRAHTFFFFFFFVLGLEARREFDLGDLRERRRLVLPSLASVGGMGAAAAIYLAFNLGSSAAKGWGIAPTRPKCAPKPSTSPSCLTIWRWSGQQDRATERYRFAFEPPRIQPVG
jgi:hypothetical protein